MIWLGNITLSTAQSFKISIQIIDLILQGLDMGVHGMILSVTLVSMTN